MALKAHIHHLLRILFGSMACLLILGMFSATVRAAEESGSIGIEGRISSAPPTSGAVISVPQNGQSFDNLPVTVSGICPAGTLVKLFKNNVFAGSTQCTNGSFQIAIDLFNGQNELIARVYDALDQAGPDSNTVTITFNDPKAGSRNRIGLTSNFAKRGANPRETLKWPIILSGGNGPYAISVDWGDGKSLDLISLDFPGIFDIEHKYDNPGVYNISIRATDKDGNIAFLQLVGVANGPLSQDQASRQKQNNGTVITRTRILWQPAALILPFLLLAFWLGRRHQLHILRKQLERGERPFS